MTEERNKPYIWVSWLAKYIAGEIMCDWNVWFRAHYTYDKIPGDFNLVKWTADHVSLLRKRTAQLQHDDWTVQIEDQNSFKYETDRYIVAGKPDIVASKAPDLVSSRTNITIVGEDSHVVEDCKTGKQRFSDCIQVILYAKFLKKLNGVPYEGNVVYNKNIIPIEMRMYDGRSNFDDTISEAMKKLSCEVPPKKYPSKQECSRCDIECCEDRIK
jgi:hypothetical protein